MRNPDKVLKSLKEHAANSTYEYQRLYRNLYNPSFYLSAYQQIFAKPGNMSAGIDGATFDGMSQKRIMKLISKVKNHSYQPKPAKRTYIPKKNGKLRPLGIPSTDDKLIQQIVKMILENIYDDTFTLTSHGFRPNHSCHTALSDLKVSFTGVKWFVEGDITGYFDNIDHHILIGILRKRIKDEYFISLIWKFLRAGYIENGIRRKATKGVHQGSIISPILANIYLNEFDCFMQRYKETIDCGSKRKLSKEYICLQNKGQRLRKKISSSQNSSETRVKLLKELKGLRNLFHKTYCSDPMDDGFKRIYYQRYADDFLIGVIGNKSDAQKIQADIKIYLSTVLKLELSQEKTLITHGKDKAQFLGYEISIGRKGTPSKDKTGKIMDRHYSKVKLYVPHQAWGKKLIQYGALRIESRAGFNDKWIPCSRPYLLNLRDYEIVQRYNWEIQGLYKYYSIADNASVLNKFYHIMKYSMLKTLADKHDTSTSKIMRKYFHNGRFCITYQAKTGQKSMFLYDDGFRKQKIKLSSSRKRLSFEMIARINKKCCEWCNAKDIEVSVHQVRKLSTLKGDVEWEKRMVTMNRKTLVLCEACHDKLHMGLLD